MNEKERDPVRSLLGMIGLAARARKLAPGAEQTVQSVRSGKAYMALVASDASKNTQKRVFNCCEYYECECRQIPVGAAGFADAAGKSGLMTAAAVTDVHMAKGIAKLLDTISSLEKGRVTEYAGN